MAPTLMAIVLAVAAPQTPILDRAVLGSRGRSIYVHPGTKLLTEAQARRLEPRIEARSRGPLFIVVLPASVRREVDGTTLGVALELNRRIFTTNPPAVEAVVIDDEFRAVNRDIDADRLATEALRAHRREGLAAVLLDFARRVGQARDRFAAELVAPPDEERDETGSGDLWIFGLLGVFAAMVAGIVLVRRRHGR